MVIQSSMDLLQRRLLGRGEGMYHSKTTEHKGYESACAGPADEVEVFAGER